MRLRRNRFNQRATAAALGLSYDQLRHALKRHKLLDANNRRTRLIRSLRPDANRSTNVV